MNLFQKHKGTFTVEQGGEQVSPKEFTESEIENERRGELAISEAARTLLKLHMVSEKDVSEVLIQTSLSKEAVHIQ